MSHTMKIKRLSSLRNRCDRIESQAIRLMKTGDLHHYIKKLLEARKVRTEYASLLMA